MDLCRIVELEWDRGHEKLEAIVRTQTDSGIIVTTIHNYVPMPGLTWIRADEVLDLDNLDDDHPSVRLANLRGSRIGGVDPALTKLDALIDFLAEEGAPVLIHLRRTGSGEGLVGQITGRTSDSVLLDEMGTQARRTGHVLDFLLTDILAVVWGDDYLTAFADLLAAEPERFPAR